ncbi:MAG TPA: hypothetical protein VE172_05175 [Stackebrandtia sp.]|jgi:phenylacetate-coenzyme A ligase PaaK-like adenylate-forming protein|uniref:hypothetical protein n=1 Tax=Stackebrandtia sp. TaxID=2023065 RepID=UPI002D72D5E2|nr:hypothetical protein [Stackebrandtia sp.]HZE38186.1 hypothetical protein [Stackebrandtia sp.]
MGAFGIWRDARRTRRRGRDEVQRRQRERLADAVAHARAASPYYRELYADLPSRVEDPGLLPVTDKRALMARFDDWTTDPDVTLDKARAFTSDAALVGAKFLDKYLVTTTSGTTGNMGIFIHDDNTLATATALVADRALRGSGGFGFGTILKLMARGGRSVKIAGTGGHFAAAAAEMSARRNSKRRAKMVRLLSVQSPIPTLVSELNAFRPAILETYASVGLLLAGEQEAGRLRIAPVRVALQGEGLPDKEYERIARAFGCQVSSSYGCNECVVLSYQCGEGWYHINEDWVIFEPVDADHSPTPPGELSHTVLLSTLFKREQPILRYDLGDSVIQRPGPCACGSPFMAVKVRGRASSVLTFPTADGRSVDIVPLLLETAVERVGGIELFQIVQAAPEVLRVRLLTVDGRDAAAVGASVCDELAKILAEHDLSNVRVEPDDEPPRQSGGGKFRTVVPLP